MSDAREVIDDWLDAMVVYDADGLLDALDAAGLEIRRKGEAQPVDTRPQLRPLDLTALVAAGLAVVPVEPTPAMVEAGEAFGTARAVWGEMLAAAPKPEPR